MKNLIETLKYDLGSLKIGLGAIVVGLAIAAPIALVIILASGGF